MPTPWKTFIAFLDQKFPRLAARYREMYRGYGEAPEKYKKELATLTHELREKYKLGSRPEVPLAKPKTAQLDLVWNPSQ
jgi:hypothetical protein